MVAKTERDPAPTCEQRELVWLKTTRDLRSPLGQRIEAKPPTIAP
jgi:hypothetical protein